MATEFVYKARNKSGDKIKGKIEAENKSVIAQQLREKGYFITEIDEKSGSIDIGEYLNMHKKVKLKEEINNFLLKYKDNLFIMHDLKKLKIIKKS